MKTRLLELVALPALLSAALGSGCANQKETVSRQDTSNETYLTGSYIPQNVERNGPVTNGKSDVRVIDRSDIDRSGGGNVQQTLRELGVPH